MVTVGTRYLFRPSSQSGDVQGINVKDDTNEKRNKDILPFIVSVAAASFTFGTRKIINGKIGLKYSLRLLNMQIRLTSGRIL